MAARLVPLIVAACICASCVGNKAYRLKQSVFHEELLTQQFDPTNTGVFDRKWPYDLAFVEFDDRGEMFDRTQLDRAVQEIRRVKSAAVAGVRPVVALFVHGWKNNASESSGNVWGFRQLLAGLKLQYGDEVPVLGIYIGWRGAVVSAPILKEFTFFDRHGKSQNLPNAHMVEALLKIMQAAKGAEFEDDSTISVLIGHSFGGAVLESALTEALMGMVLKGAPSGTVRWPATLIMLLNEAQEATRSYQLIEALHANLPAREACLPSGQKQRPQVPAILSITSTGDSATRVAFPAAQSLARPFNSLRTYPQPNFLGLGSQTPMFFNTTAHLGEFRSHLMGRADEPDIQQAWANCKPAIEALIEDVCYVVVEKPGARNRTPYWAMHMPTAIVPDHSTIFGSAFRRFLTTLIMQATIPESAATEPGVKKKPCEE